MKKNRFEDEFNQSLAHNTARLGHLMRRETLRCLNGLGITPEQWQALVYLSGYDTDQDSLSQHELTELLLKDKTTVSRLIENMLRSDLIWREVGYDRRSYRLHLTNRGREVLEAAWPTIHQHFPGQVFAVLDPIEQAELLRLLQKVRQHLEQP